MRVYPGLIKSCWSIWQSAKVLKHRNTISGAFRRPSSIPHDDMDRSDAAPHSENSTESVENDTARTLTEHVKEDTARLPRRSPRRAAEGRYTSALGRGIRERSSSREPTPRRSRLR